jgi:hypothetical protein
MTSAHPATPMTRRWDTAIGVFLVNRRLTVGLTPPRCFPTLALTGLDGVAPVALIAEEETRALITTPCVLPTAVLHEPSRA